MQPDTQSGRRVALPLRLHVQRFDNVEVLRTLHVVHEFYDAGVIADQSGIEIDVGQVAPGDLFLGRYRILKIGNATIEFEEPSSGRTGTANMEDAGPTT